MGGDGDEATAFRAEQFVASARGGLGRCAGTPGALAYRPGAPEYETVFPGQRDCILSADGIVDAVASFAAPGAQFFQGLEAAVAIHLRDRAGRPVKCDPALPLTVLAFPHAIAGTASCHEEGFAVYFCFISVEPQVTLRIEIAGVALSNSPLVIPLLPAFMARAGCARPGVSSLTSPCMPRLSDFVLGVSSSASEGVEEEGFWSGAPAHSAGDGSTGDGWSQMLPVTRNVYRLRNVCLEGKSLVLFAHRGHFPLPFQPEEMEMEKVQNSEHAQSPENEYQAEGGHSNGSNQAESYLRDSGLVIGAHAWGQWKERALQIPLTIALHPFRAAGTSSRHDGEGRGSQVSDDDGEILYVFPEGPTTHFGHMLMDLVVPLYVTTQLVSDARARKTVVLWPWASFRCPTKGETVHSKRFWDLLRGVTSHPHDDVVFLASLPASGRPLCNRNVVVGQALDMRVGYWYSPSYHPRTVPFLEDWPDAIAALVRAAGEKAADVRERQRRSGDERAQEDRAEQGIRSYEGRRKSRGIEAILICRQTRRILNADAVERTMQELGFRVSVVDWANMSLYEQIATMQHTSLLLGMHGTGLNNIAFARPGTVLVDILPYCLANASDFWEISQMMRVRHYVWRNPSPARSSCSLAGCAVPGWCVLWCRGGGETEG